MYTVFLSHDFNFLWRSSKMRLGPTNETVEVEVVLGRRLIGTFMTIYMPTILLNIIGHSTNYFKPFFFEAVVTVNLTVSWTIIINILGNIFNYSGIRSCWYWPLCLLESAKVSPRQAASRWLTTGWCSTSWYLLWRFSFTHMRTHWGQMRQRSITMAELSLLGGIKR